MLTYVGANEILSIICGKKYQYPYTNIYVGLSTTTPNREGLSYTEPPSSAGYARVLLGSSVSGASATQKMDNPALGAITNKDIIYFPEATGAWGTCTHFLIFNAATEGALLAYGALTNEISPVNGTVPLIRVGDLDMSVS